MSYRLSFFFLFTLASILFIGHRKKVKNTRTAAETVMKEQNLKVTVNMSRALLIG